MVDFSGVDLSSLLNANQDEVQELMSLRDDAINLQDIDLGV